jgi:AraC-like DNA-binding protein
MLIATSARVALTRNGINRVVNKVHLVCDHEWTLAELASIACLSKYHIFSVFQSGLGETPGQFVHPIRLERAARLLIYNRLFSITDVAHTCGFGRSQALSRAFRSRFWGDTLGVSSRQKPDVATTSAYLCPTRLSMMMRSTCKSSGEVALPSIKRRSCEGVGWWPGSALRKGG